jgi:ribulose-5-phosphate 4-epimerase/fuculose-1-phosphate aldolase
MVLVADDLPTNEEHAVTTPPQEISDTVHAHWALAAAGLSDFIWGHASVRAGHGDGIYIKSSGWAFEEVDESKVIEVSWDGRLTSGSGSVHIEVPIHTQVMRARPDVGCVVHCHAPAVTAFASLDQPIRAISHEGVFFADNLPRFERTGDLIRTRELGDALADVLGDAPAAIIPQHGLVAAGPDPAAAVMYAVLLEKACRIQLMAAAAGGPKRWSDDAEITAKKQTAFQPFGKTYRYLVDCGARMHSGQLPVLP